MKVNIIFPVQWTTYAVEKEPGKIQGRAFIFSGSFSNSLDCSFYCVDYVHFHAFQHCKVNLSFEKKIVLYSKLNIYMAFRYHLNFHLA